MRRTTAIALVLLLLLAPSARARDITPDEVIPTQPYAGFDNIKDMVGRWKGEAARSGQPWGAWVLEVLKPRMEAQPLIGVLDPEGRFRNLDAHHRVGALQLVAAETGVELHIPTRVEADFRGQQRSEMDRWLAERNMVFPNVSKRLPRRGSPSEHWPRTFKALQDDPLRSAVGNALYNLGIDSVHGKPYLEFRIAALLEQEGINGKLRQLGVLSPREREIPTGRGTDPQVVAVVERMILTSKSIGRFFLLEAGTGRSAAMATQYRQAKKRRGEDIRRMPVEERAKELSLLQTIARPIANGHHVTRPSRWQHGPQLRAPDRPRPKRAVPGVRAMWRGGSHKSGRTFATLLESWR